MNSPILAERRALVTAILLLTWGVIPQGEDTAEGALLTFDMRIAPQADQPTGVTVTSNHLAQAKAGSVVQLQLWAVISNSDNNQANDGFLQGQGSFQSLAIGSSPILWGNLRGGTSMSAVSTENNLSPFANTGAASGYARDVDNDSDIDVGDINVHTTQPMNSANLWFVAKANEFPLPHLGPTGTNSNALEQLIGTTTFTLSSSALLGQSTLIDFIPRKFENSLSGKIFRYRSDGSDHTEAYTNSNIDHSGSVVSVLVPEPSPFMQSLVGLITLVSIGYRKITLLLFAKSQSRRLDFNY